MKILEVISEAPPVRSGISRVAERLTKGLNNHGYTVSILSLQDIPRLEFGEIRLSSMPVKLAGLKDTLKEYDIIHLHGPVPTFSDVFLLWGLRDICPKPPKLVYTYHAPIDLKILPLRPFVVIYNKLQEWLAHIADHVVVTTPSYAQRLATYVPASKLSTIPWGVDYNQFDSPVLKPGPYTVLYLGQVRPYKGLPVLLRAASGLENTRIWVIGDGHYLQTCRQMANDIGLDNVTFWGNVSDERLVQLVQKAHVIVLPSVTRSEAFGIALLEGMAAGLVPVASFLPGVADLIGNEGITFPPGDFVALRSILGRLRDDESLRMHLASLAQAKSHLYSWDRSIFGYTRVFKNLVGESNYLTWEYPVYPLIPLPVEERSEDR
jgi:glycosyltransferase involved in cell wall biosynthesis